MSEVKDIYLRELAKLKAIGTFMLIGFGAAIIIAFILFITLLKRFPENQTLTLLKRQQQFFDSLSKEQKKTAEQDRLRDSIYWTNYVQNNKERNGQLTTTKKKTDEIINRINQPDFNADSIRLWWANN